MIGHDRPLYDAAGYRIETRSTGSRIELYGWTLTEDSRGRPIEHVTGKLLLTRRQALELASRLIAATA